MKTLARIILFLLIVNLAFCMGFAFNELRLRDKSLKADAAFYDMKTGAFKFGCNTALPAAALEALPLKGK